MNSGICGYPPLDETVDRMRPRRLARGGATAGQVLKWNGSVWSPGVDQTGGGGEFLSLTDTPSSFQAEAYPRVNAAGTALIWRDAPETRNDLGLTLGQSDRIEIFSDFVNASGVLPFTTATTGSGAAVSSLTNLTPTFLQRVFGQIVFETGSTATGMARVQWGSGNVAAWNLIRLDDGRAKRLFARVLFSTLPDATNAFDVRIGFAAVSDATTNFIRMVGGWGSSPQNTWRLQSRRNSTDTFLDASSGWVANQWDEIEFRIPSTGGSVEFFINGTSIGTISTNVPTDQTTSYVFLAEILKSAGTTSRQMFMDYLGLVVTGSR